MAAALPATPTSYADLGRVPGADLTEAELRYPIDAEGARRADDVVWRRSKLGLRLTAAEIAAIDIATRRLIHDGLAVAGTGGSKHHGATYPRRRPGHDIDPQHHLR